MFRGVILGERNEWKKENERNDKIEIRISVSVGPPQKKELKAMNKARVKQETTQKFENDADKLFCGSSPVAVTEMIT